MPLVRRSWPVVGAATVFLAVQVWMSWAIWQRTGNAPPEPDDSYAYITGIQLIAQYGTPLPALPGLSRTQVLDTGMAHLTYNAVLGLAARLTGQTAARIYFASFFVGKVALLAALLFFLSRAGLTVVERAGALLILGMYAGDPATHGLYWVVPSFWLLTAFLTLAALLFSAWRRPALGVPAGFLAAVLFIGIHPLSLWASLAIALFAALATVKEGATFWRPRWGMLLGLAVGVAAMVGATALLTLMMQVPHPSQSLSAQMAGLFARPAAAPGAVPPGSLWERIYPRFPGAWLIWTTYLRFLITQPNLIPLGLGLAVVWRRRPSLALLWAAVVVGVLASALHPMGSRTVLFAWPLTYVLMAIGFLDMMARLRARFPRMRTLLGGLTALLAFAAMAGTLSYSLGTIRDVARARDFSWDPSCAGFLLQSTDDRAVIEYSDKFAIGAFMTHGLLERRSGTVADYLSAGGAGGRGRYLFVESPLAVVKRERVEAPLGRPLTPLRTCGFFTIFSAQ